MQKRALIIDTDPGLDDALAILMAIGSPVFDLKALTIVAGNVTVEKCTLNARRILTLAGGTNIPVYKGASQPLGESWRTLEDVFGESGLAGAEDIDPSLKTKEQVTEASDFLVEYFSKPQTNTTLCCIGPLTNLANALKKEPSIARNIDELVIMGGCIFPDPVHQQMGNIMIPNSQEHAEFNFISDPDAAALVFKAPFKSIALIDLATTRSALFNGKRYHQLKQVKGPVTETVLKMMTEYGDNVDACYQKIKETPDEKICAIHDTVAIGYMINPQAFETFSSYLKIEIQNPLLRGQSLMVDKSDDQASYRPVTLIKSLDQDMFYEDLVLSLQAYSPAQSKAC